MIRLRLRFSHLNECKFRHGPLDTLNPLCNCSLQVEDNEHFFLRCVNFENARRYLIIEISSINSSFKNLPSHLIVKLLLFGDSKLSAIDNNLILKASIKCIMTTNRFSVPFFWYCFLSLALYIYIHTHTYIYIYSFFIFHCSIWEISEICACAVFSCLFFSYLLIFLNYFLSCPIIINYIVEKKEEINSKQ